MERSRFLKGVANLPRVVSELSYMRSLTHAAVARGPIWLCAFGPVLSEISDLCEISDLLLFVSCSILLLRVKEYSLAITLLMCVV